MGNIIKNDKPTIRAWAMFDWANSAYNLVITSTIFPAYYTIITLTEEYGDQVNFFGFSFINTALANYSLAFSYLVMVILLPIFSAIADYKGNRKSMMKVFTYIGGIACMGLYFFKLETLEWGIICSSLAAMGYIGGVLFNNSYLPEIATVDQQDAVSAKGFAYGYIGSVVLQLICFLFVLKPEWFGIEDPSFPARLSFLLVGIWWILFSQISFRKLPNKPRNQNKLNHHIIKKGFNELKKVWFQIKILPSLKGFLFAFFFYAMGVQTIMLVAAAFGEKVLHLGASKLIITILLIQIVAIAGAYLMSWLASKIGNVRVLMIVVTLWIVICISAFFISNEMQFYILAMLVGLVMGGTQSISRSTFSKLIPINTEDNASFFSFYDVTEKIAIVIGLFSFGFIEELTHNIRLSALFLVLFFLIGLILLFRMPKAIVLQQNDIPG
ncbi:MFS transporter [Albibacterium bauzanense]|uniref:UMF1 family MFS transporter n=1 Tax=Albibacterium bauzanense TaxID=653929 RepID=A0A4R1LZ12_9SPHI|nr:MFS transporter [Albibacterium bauzanense]TCK84816.1 UMF1 family MFS transporter [Albibacterium bauzanense]